MNQTLKKLTLIHTIISVGVALAIIVAYVVTQQKIFGLEALISKNLDSVLIFFVPLFALLGYITSMVFFKKKVVELKKTPLNLEHKLNKYSALCIAQYALLEAPIVLACIASILMGNTKYLLLAVGLTLVLWFQKPSQEKMNHELNEF